VSFPDQTAAGAASFDPMRERELRTKGNERRTSRRSDAGATGRHADRRRSIFHTHPNVLAAAGLTTVGEVRETADETLLSFQDFGPGSVTLLRETLGLPSCDGVRPR
jgi:hypothetical protein